MHGEHDALSRLLLLPEKKPEHFDDELHRRVIIIMQDDRIFGQPRVGILLLEDFRVLGRRALVLTPRAELSG